MLKANLNLRNVGVDKNGDGGRRLSATSGGKTDERERPKVTHRELFATRRELQEQASKSDPRLQDLYEIEFELGELADGNKGSPIRTFINTEREYIARWSPLNLDLLSEFVEIEAMGVEDLETDMPNAIFDLPASAYALVTLDLRHVPAESYEWTYGDDWAVSFSLSEDLTLGDLSRPLPMPEQFLSKKVVKS